MNVFISVTSRVADVEKVTKVEFQDLEEHKFLSLYNFATTLLVGALKDGETQVRLDPSEFHTHIYRADGPCEKCGKQQEDSTP